jgi:hypothetical protein
MKYTVKSKLDTGQPSRGIPAAEQGNATAEHPPEAGGDAQIAGSRRRAGAHIDRPKANACTQSAQQNLKNDGQDYPAKDGGPRNTPVRMIVLGENGSGLNGSGIREGRTWIGSIGHGWSPKMADFLGPGHAAFEAVLPMIMLGFKKFWPMGTSTKLLTKHVVSFAVPIWDICTTKRDAGELQRSVRVLSAISASLPKPVEIGFAVWGFLWLEAERKPIAGQLS